MTSPESREESAARRWRRAARTASQAGAVGAGLTGALALLGWACGIPALKSVLPGLVAMKANTALGLVLCGAALGLLAGEEPRPRLARAVSMACAAAAASLGLLTLVEYLFGVPLGIDQLVLREPAGAVLTAHLGRMALPTAVEFLLLGAALLLLAAPGPRRAAQGLATAAAALAGLAAGGYAFGREAFFTQGGATPIAIHTAAAFVLLSLGTLAARPSDAQLESARRNAARLGFWGSFFILGLVSAGAFSSMSGLLAANRWVERAHELLGWNSRLLAALQSAEAGSRGFVITGKEEFLSSYASDVALARECLRAAAAAAARDAGQGQRLAGLASIVSAKAAFMDETIRLRRARGRAAAELLIARGEGRRLMDAVLEVTAGVADEERRLLAARTAAARAKASLTRFFLGAGSLASMLLLAAVFRTLRRETAQRRLNEERVLQLNGQLAGRKLELEAANKELETFSYSVSHDLRAPLRAMDGFSQALLDEYAQALDAQGRDYLGRVRAAARRMARLIDELLALSRVTRTELRRVSVDLSALARAAAEELSGSEPGRRVDFVIAPDLCAEGDPALLRVVLDNLLGNAWKFTARRPRARVEFGASESGDGRAFFVRDDGAGFDMAYADKLFGAFQRLHATSEFPGTGIGLATVSRIVRRHGGRIWAEGGAGLGATFHFTLPQAS